MGYIKHDCVIAVVYDADTSKVEDFRERMPEHIQGYLLGPARGVNGHDTFCFAPDGSKEGWSESDEAEKWREDFLDFVRDKCQYPDIVHLQLGGDDHKTIVHFTTDDTPEEY